MAPPGFEPGPPDPETDALTTRPPRLHYRKVVYPRICTCMALFCFSYILNYINYIDDTKVFSVVSDINNVNKLQTDLKNLCKWSEDWLMLFNVEKC